MKVILKYMFVSIAVTMLCASCKSLPTSERKKDFIILQTKDTIYGDQLNSTKWFNKLGRVTIINGSGANEVRKVYAYDKIYQVHYYDRKNRKSVVEMIEEYPNYKDTRVEMYVVINQGKVKLYYHDPGQWADRPFIVSDIYYGYAHKHRFKKLLNELDKCEAFRKKFTEKKQRRRRYLVTLVEYYNANCE